MNDVELETETIDGIEEKGIRLTDGRLIELDVLVYSTGFKTDAFIRPLNLTGEDGVLDVNAEVPFSLALAATGSGLAAASSSD